MGKGVHLNGGGGGDGDGGGDNGGDVDKLEPCGLKQLSVASTLA